VQKKKLKPRKENSERNLQQKSHKSETALADKKVDNNNMKTSTSGKIFS